MVWCWVKGKCGTCPTFGHANRNHSRVTPPLSNPPPADAPKHKNSFQTASISFNMMSLIKSKSSSLSSTFQSWALILASSMLTYLQSSQSNSLFFWPEIEFTNLTTTEEENSLHCLTSRSFNKYFSKVCLYFTAFLSIFHYSVLCWQNFDIKCNFWQIDLHTFYVSSRINNF